jgi:hypothetical protein
LRYYDYLPDQYQVMNNRKVIFVGNARTNKSTIARSLTGHEPLTSYTPTLGAEVGMYHGQSGTPYSIWDCSGSYPGLGEGYWIKADIAILFSSSHEDHSSKSLPHQGWMSKLSECSSLSAVYTLYDATVEDVKSILV